MSDISFPGSFEIEFTRPMQQFQQLQHVYLFHKQEGLECHNSALLGVQLGVMRRGLAWLSTWFRLASLSFAQCRNSKNVAEQKSTLTVNQIGAWCRPLESLVAQYREYMYNRIQCYSRILQVCYSMYSVVQGFCAISSTVAVCCRLRSLHRAHMP